MKQNLMTATKDDMRKYAQHIPSTFFDVCVRKTHLPVKIGCPFHLGNVIRCLDYALDCPRCLTMYVYCRNLTGVGRV